jgi:nucleoside-diphosphate-sugar epimerase
MRSDYGEPLNLCTEEVMSINELAQAVIEVSGKPGITVRHVDGPQGVRGRNSDNRRLRAVLGWEPSTTIREGLQPTYEWIDAQVRTAGHPGATIPTADRGQPLSAEVAS